MAAEETSIRAAGPGDKEILRQLLEFTAYEHSRFDGAELDGHGRFGYLYLDHYWTEAGRCPYLIAVGGNVAGMALVREGPPHHMAEFLVMPRYRRTGAGTAAARELFSRHPGQWEVHEVAGNGAAVEFWRQAIPCPFTEHQDVDGTTQRFCITPGAPSLPPE